MSARKSILVIDNYDSFTWNLVHYLEEAGAHTEVVRNDQISVADALARGDDGVVLSPGPCTPNEAGISVALIERFAGRIPILGVCLGHQAIGQAFGGEVVRARTVMHGKLSDIHHADLDVFRGLPQPFRATRYHSLVVARESLPPCLEMTAWTVDQTGAVDEIMGFRHRELAVSGVQFHPESIMTDAGHALLGNFLNPLPAAA